MPIEEVTAPTAGTYPRYLGHPTPHLRTAFEQVTASTIADDGGAILHSDIVPTSGLVLKTAAETYTTIKIKTDATAAPTNLNDTTDGYSVGSLWIDVSNDAAYYCVDASAGAAVWLPVSPIRSVQMEYDNPAAGKDYLFGAIPEAGVVMSCFGKCAGTGTPTVNFSVTSRARGSAFTAAGETDIVDDKTATEAGTTVTLASTALAADRVLRVITESVSGTTQTKLLVVLYYKVKIT